MTHFGENEKIFTEQTPVKTSRYVKTEIIQDQSMDLEFFSLSNTVSHSIENLEKRLDTCNGIYKLATNTNSIRDRERENQVQASQKLLESFEDRLSKAEETIENIPNMVKDAVSAEYSKNKFNLRIEQMLEIFVTEMNDQMDALEQMITTKDKLKMKNIKSVKKSLILIQSSPKDDSIITDLEAQVSSLKKTQQKMTDVFNAIQSDPTKS